MPVTTDLWNSATGLYGTGHEIVDMSDMMAAILLDDTSFMASIKKGRTIENIEHKWIEETLNAKKFTASYTAATNVLTITDPTTNAALLAIVRKGAVVMFPSTNFMIQFGSDPVVGDNTMTVVFGTDADASSGDCAVVSLPYTDTESASPDISQSRTIRKNYCQTFERSVEINLMRESMATYGVKDEFAHQLDLRMREMKDEMDRQMIMGIASKSGGSFSPDVERPMYMGLVNYIRDYDFDTTLEDTTVVNAASAALSTTYLDTLMQTIYEAGGLDSKCKPTLWMSRQQKVRFSALESTIRRSSADENEVGVDKDTFICSLDGRKIPVKVDRNLTLMRPDCVVFADTSRLEWHALKGDDVHMGDVARSTIRARKRQITGSFTLTVKNADAAHGLIRGLATS